MTVNILLRLIEGGVIVVLLGLVVLALIGSYGGWRK